MALIAVKTSKGDQFQVEVGPMAGAFLPLFDKVVADLAKPGAGPAAAVERVSEPQFPPEYGRAFVYCVERLVAGEQVPAEWTIWCGGFAAKSMAGTCRKAMIYLGLLIAGLAVTPFLLRGRPDAAEFSNAIRLGGYIFVAALVWLAVSARGWLRFRSAECLPLPSALAQQVAERAEGG
jgi:hypothetical protein